MMARVPYFTRFVIAVAVVFAALALLARKPAFAAPAVAVYRGEASAASGRVEGSNCASRSMGQ